MRANRRFAVLHDRYFLDRVVSKVVEIFQHKGYVYQGNYSDYAKKKAAIRAAMIKQYYNQQPQNKSGDQMERKEERVMARQSIFKFNERVTTEAKDATYEFRGPVISVRNLEKKFGEHEVLKDISFDLFEGDVVCIIGSSGSGKSTLLRCINHLETPTSGQILYHGYPLTKDAQTINRFRSQVGMVFQQFNLFNNMTVFDNCMAGVSK